MGDTSTLLLVIMAAVLVSMVVAVVVVRRGQSRADALLDEVGTASRTIAATAMGLSGDEEAPSLRGTGTLALTATELAFAQWRPQHLLRIPLSAIVSVEATNEHLGRTFKTEVLRITWQSPGRGGGAERSVAFFVRDPEPWLADLRR